MAIDEDYPYITTNGDGLPQFDSNWSATIVRGRADC